MAEHDRLERGLREHLARQRPLHPGAAERVVAAVRSGTEGRRRRPHLHLATGLASGAVLAAVLGAAVWARTSGEPQTSPSPGAGSSAAGERFRPADVAFGTATHGWEAGRSCDAAGACVLAVRSSADGGRSWSAAATVHPGAPGSDPRIAFAGATGYVADGGLWTSGDGGATWHDTGLGPDVVGVAPVGRSVMALEACPASPACTVRMQVSGDAGRTWSAPAPVPGLAGPLAAMVRVSATGAFVAGSAGLAATQDGGRTWEPLPDPCAPGMLAAPPEIAALEGTELWAACEAPAPASGRAVYRSRDGGHHWELRADATTASSLGAPGGLTGLALAPRGAVLLALRDGPLLRSPDGATWSAVLDGGVLRLDLLDPQHGWLVTANGTVLATADGGRTWR